LFYEDVKTNKEITYEDLLKLSDDEINSIYEKIFRALLSISDKELIE
jgi:hypothetical protein